MTYGGVSFTGADGAACSGALEQAATHAIDAIEAHCATRFIENLPNFERGVIPRWRAGSTVSEPVTADPRRALYLARATVGRSFAPEGVAMPARNVRAHARLAVRIWAGIAALFVVLAVAVAVCISALVGAYRAIEHTSALATAERHAVAIGVAAREQYLHETHGVLLRDVSHFGHERHWAKMLANHVEHLRPLVNGPERARLEAIEADSDELGKIFTHEIYPAAIAKDDVRLRKAHADAEDRVEAMIGASDASVAQLSVRTREASESATSAGYRAILIASIATAIAAVVAFLLAAGLARQLVRPVRALNASAARIGRGEFVTEVPQQATWEFEQLAHGLRQMAEQLHERELRLLEAERLATVGAIAAGVAHELNNPLGIILGYLKRVRSKAPNELADELGIVDDEAQQCRRIVEDLVTLAREPRLEKTSLDVATLVRDVCDRMRTIPEMEGHEVRFAVGHAAHSEVDSTRIAQVVRNLVLNAALASPPGAPVDVAVDKLEHAVRIVVRDVGAGIDEADLPHVFEPFYSRRTGGTGLGLAVSHGIVRTHGGSIDIDSRRGAGTTVVVRLPASGGAS